MVQFFNSISAHAQHPDWSQSERGGFKLPVVCHGGVVEYAWSEKLNQTPLLPPPPPLFSSLVILRSGLGGIWRTRGESRAGIGIAKVIDRRHSGARIRLSMAAHKPVEWVQAIINRFDEQVKKTSVGRFDISRPKKRACERCKCTHTRCLCGRCEVGGFGLCTGQIQYVHVLIQAWCVIFGSKSQILGSGVVIDLMNVQLSRSRALAKYKQKESDSLRACWHTERWNCIAGAALQAPTVLSMQSCLKDFNKITMSVYQCCVVIEVFWNFTMVLNSK